ncbi:MAG: c-type cytochrome, partial [Planctomycetia bacterium]
RPTALQLAAAANYAPAVDAIEAVAADANAPADLRTEAVRALGTLKTEKAVDALMRVGQPENPLSLEVVKALGQHLPTGPKPTEANTRAFDALKFAIMLEKASAPLKAAALNALTGSRAGTDYLLALKEKNEMPAALVADAGKLLRNSPFQGSRNKALLLFPAPGKLDPKKLPTPAVLAKRTGNADAGKQIAMKSLTNEVQCLKCHTVRGQGGQIGPDLSMIGKKDSKENLYESILNPSKAIADQYVSVTVNTADGQTITGLVVGESESTLTLRDANGKDYAIPLKDVDSRKKSLVSLMPENLVAGLTEDELVDLVEYLMTLQTPPPTP